MIIKTRLGDEIVNTLKEVINQDINLIDEDGIIISSTNPDRINTFHEAGKECVKKKTSIVIEYDEQYKGSKKGINVPVKLENRVVGVIGISGEVSEVEKYGTIIKKMTEILLRDQWLKEIQDLEKERTRNLIEAIIYNRIEYHSFIPSNIFSKNKFLATAKIKNVYDIDKNNLLNHLIINGDINNSYISIVQDEIVILLLTNSKQEVTEYLGRITKILKNKLNFNPIFGISENFKSLKSSDQYYNQCHNSLKREKFTKPKSNLLFYDDIDIGFLVTDIEEKKLYEYSYRVLKNLDNKELIFFKNLITYYGIYNGSIKKLSEHFFMHKNSIQYQLNKLYKLTGYNPRELNGYVVLWLAFLGV